MKRTREDGSSFPLFFWISPGFSVFSEWRFEHETVDVMVLFKLRLPVFHVYFFKIRRNMCDLNVRQFGIKFVLIYL